MQRCKLILGVIIVCILLTLTGIVGLKFKQEIASKNNMRRVAIVGAGIAGSSAAFFLNKQLTTLGLRDQVDIIVYEKASQVGGRVVTVHPYNDSTYAPIDVGALFFIDACLHIKRAMQEFNLKPKSLALDPDHSSYLYNGQSMIADMKNLTNRYNPASLVAMKTATVAFVKDFLKFYQRSFQISKGPFRTLDAYSQAMNFRPTINESGFDYFTKNGVDVQVANELIDGIVQANYGQQITNTHAMMTSITVAASNGFSIEGGNRQIIEKMIASSSAKLQLNKPVKKISKNAENEKWIITTDDSSDQYDAVILATPPHYSNMIVDVRDQIKKPKYIKRYSTIFATNATHLGPSYLNVPVPVNLMITRYLERQNVTQKDLNLDIEMVASFKMAPPRKENILKLFSSVYLDDNKLAQIVGGKENVGWIYRTSWYGLPIVSPTSEENPFSPINPDENFYYVNTFESYISTMETETLAAHNIVRLLINDFGYDEKAATLADDYWVD